MRRANVSRSEIDLDTNKLVLQVVNRKLRSLDQRIDEAITDGQLERTIEGASTLTLTLHDPKRALLRSGVFSRMVEVRLEDRLWFRLVKVSKSDDDLTLTFEDREVDQLRRRDKPRKANRKNVTRAQFALSLIREVRPAIAYRIPELRVKQPVKGAVAARGEQRRALPYQVRRGDSDGKREDSWTCLQRLASEVGWRCFASQGVVWFVSETWLNNQKASFLWTEETTGVVAIDFDLDSGKRAQELTITARAARWQAGPGAAVDIDGLGPANGKWIVSRMSRGLYDANASITLKRPSAKLPEPAPEMETVQPATRAGGGGTSSVAARRQAVNGSASGVPPAVQRALQAANAMDARRFPYVWGGGHGAAGQPSGGGYDCSGSTVAILAAAGLGFRMGGPTAVSSALASWGVAGQGEWLTIYANSQHVFMEFRTAGGWRHFGTGRFGKASDGPGWNPMMHPHGGFAVRHWVGL
jgi:hypothetical protein